VHFTACTFCRSAYDSTVLIKYFPLPSFMLSDGCASEVVRLKDGGELGRECARMTGLACRNVRVPAGLAVDADSILGLFCRRGFVLLHLISDGVSRLETSPLSAGVFDFLRCHPVIHVGVTALTTATTFSLAFQQAHFGFPVESRVSPLNPILLRGRPADVPFRPPIHCVLAPQLARHQ
jgi:hypothetical protein